MGQGSNRASQGQKKNLNKFNCCIISEEVGDMSVVRVREDGMLLGGKWGNGYSEDM